LTKRDPSADSLPQRVRSEEVHVGRPNIGNRERLMARVGDMLDRRWLTNGGPYVLELEARLAEYLGVTHVIAMCNATVALEIAIKALDLKGEVIVPSFTFVATAHALQWQAITPVFCEIDPRTHMLDPEQAERLITPRTTGILGVHLWGDTCDVDGLQAAADRHGLTLLFDAAHAFGCSRKGTMVGNFGAAEVFSFHATKFFNTFEGGAVATNDGTLAQKIRLMKNFGFSGYDMVVSIGTNGKMSEISAAMGLTSLESIDEFIAVNRRHYLRYRGGLSGVPAVRFLEHDERERSNFQYIVVEIDNALAKASRDDIMNGLWEQHVLARRYFYPGVHNMEPYRTLAPYYRMRLPRTEALVQRTLVLPTGTAVTDDDIDFICRFIRAAVRG
jgi:dTDP-4-amino-4,6-dideoxygalactose transaminase